MYQNMDPTLLQVPILHPLEPIEDISGIKQWSNCETLELSKPELCTPSPPSSREVSASCPLLLVVLLSISSTDVCLFEGTFPLLSCQSIKN